MCIQSSSITSMREVDEFFPHGHKFCKKNVYWFSGGDAIAKLHRLEVPPTDLHALTLLESVCFKGRGFSGFVSHEISLFCL